MTVSRKTLANRRANAGAVAGPVTVRRADGSTVELPPYSPAEARRVIRRGKQQPRGWSDPGSGRYAGGNDFVT